MLVPLSQANRGHHYCFSQGVRVFQARIRVRRCFNGSIKVVLIVPTSVVFPFAARQTLSGGKILTRRAVYSR